MITIDPSMFHVKHREDIMTTEEGRRMLTEAGHAQLGDLAQRWSAAVDAATRHTVEIPADVRDNSETVTDYAFMGHRAPDRGVRTTTECNRAIMHADTFRYARYQWYDVNQRGGQRCRFDMMVNEEGAITHLFHTEYFTRVKCADCEHSYAGVYQMITTSTDTSEAVPRCDHHADMFRRNLTGLSDVHLHESEPLRIGQHD